MSVIGSHLLTSSTEEVTLPANAYYFTISTKQYDGFKVIYRISEKYNADQLSQSNSNITDYLKLNDLIPEGVNETSFTGETLKLLVQPPLHLTKDINNTIKISIDEIESNNDMFVWDKRLAAFGYNDELKQESFAYEKNNELIIEEL